MFVFLSILAMSLIGFIIHLSLDKEPRTTGRVIELLLLYQLVFSVGMTSFLAFFALYIMPDFIAQYTGWPASPFEQQLGNVNLAFGVLGTLCIWLRGHFWTATVLGFSIWIFSDGIAHIMDMEQHHNYAPGNIGVPLYTDIAVPAVLVILLAAYLGTAKARLPQRGNL
jgi:hypothetical protein